MKANRTVLVALVATLFTALHSTAQQSGPVAFNHLEKVGKIIGMTVTDSRNQHAGRVNDLAIDWQAGRIAVILIDTGGFLTSKQRIVAVPPESFTLADSSAVLRMSADIDAFDNAPEFNILTWNESTEGSSVTDVYKRFHMRPYSPIGHLERAGRIIGLAAGNQRTERLGKVEDLVVELPSGKMPDVIFASTGFLGVKNGELTAVPPTGFIFMPGATALILDTSKKSLKNAPHFKASDWRTGINNTLNPSAIDDTFKVLLSLTADDTNNPAPPAITQQGITNRASDADTQADAAITLEIARKIMAAQGLSLDALHVQVSTHKGRVTLIGIVDSEKEKKQVGDIAASVVPADHVDNRIEVRIFAVAMIQQNNISGILQMPIARSLQSAIYF